MLSAIQVRITFLLIMTFIIGDSSIAQTKDQSNLKIGGAFMGVCNYINQQRQSNVDGKRSQFDLALNLDFEYVIHPKIRGFAQLQTGPGEGSLGFSGPGVSVTDLNLEFDFNPSFTFAIGSFDTPFCLETQYLTNNGDGFSNALFLNSLFYSAFAGTNVGTLNTLGIKGIFTSKVGKVTMAITNGTNESAFNPDGNFEIVLSGCTKALLPGLNLAGSFISSKDSSHSGSSGTGTKYQGWIVDSRYDFTDGFFIHGFYGMFDYDDNRAVTSDRVTVWKTEARYGKRAWHIASRISAWYPEKIDENKIGVSPGIPNPGLGILQGKAVSGSDHKIIRIETAFGYILHEDLLFKCEYFRDNYGASQFMKDFYVQGIIFALNARF